VTGRAGEIPEATVARVLDTCLGVAAGERVVLLRDAGTDAAVIAALAEGLRARRAVPVLVEVPTFVVPGTEPPASVAEALLAADAGIELTSAFIGSSRARQNATAAGRRYLAMPAVEAGTFRLGGPLDVDFDALVDTTVALARAWEAASEYRITTPGGTDLRGSVQGRKGRALTGVARNPGDYMAPPDVESGTAPVEGSSNGVVVIDGDFLFMGKGPVSAPVTLEIRDGELIGLDSAAFRGTEGERLTEMIARVADPRMPNLAEVAVGLNPNGSVCGVPMETESTKGSAHIAFGNSIAYGGTVAAPAHLDCVMRDATVFLDGVPRIVAGELVN
jgi:2,5-dihydroxypyridine 5,6-dioxygenase